MNEINFKSKNIIKNIKNALKASKHIKNDEEIRVCLNYNIPISKNVEKYINLIVIEIMKNDLINNNFTEKFIEENIIYILDYLYLFNESIDESIDSLCTNVIEYLENKIKNIIEDKMDKYLCVFHINNLELENTIQLGDVTLFPINKKDSELDEYNNNAYIKNFFKEGHVYAKTYIFGLKKYSSIKAQNNIKITLNALKFLLPPEKCNFNLDVDTTLPNYKQHIIFNSNGEIHSGFKLESSFSHCKLSEEDLKLYNFEFYILSILLSNKKPSDFEKRLITALYWFGEAMSIKTRGYKIIKNNDDSLYNLEFFNEYLKLLFLMVSLESVLVFENNQKAENISMRVSELIARPESKKKIKAFIKRMYTIRSTIVHSGSDYISQEDLKKLVKYTKLTLSYLIFINYSFNL